jgi:hypothetical protein
MRCEKAFGLDIYKVIMGWQATYIYMERASDDLIHFEHAPNEFLLYKMDFTIFGPTF